MFILTSMLAMLRCNAKILLGLRIVPKAVFTIALDRAVARHRKILRVHGVQLVQF